MRSGGRFNTVDRTSSWTGSGLANRVLFLPSLFPTEAFRLRTGVERKLRHPSLALLTKASEELMEENVMKVLHLTTRPLVL